MPANEGGSSVFISYRRTDSAYALLIYKALLERFESEHLYRDIEGIAPGADFLDALRRELARCRVLLAIVGPGWIRARKRLLQEEDVVRLELRLALRRKAAVVPLLVGGAAMPASDDLPESLRPVTRRNAIVLSDLRFDRDMEAVVDVVRRHVPAKPPRAAATFGDLRLVELLRLQIRRLQIRAVELVQRGEIERALDELQEGQEIAMELLHRTPPDTRLDAHLGYLYKTFAQALDATGHPLADEYLDVAAGIFHRLKRLGEAGHLPADLFAGALNGLGNIAYQRRQYEEAIRCSRAAVQVLPEYGYAWHDLFLALVGRARSGGAVDIPQMQEALTRVKETGARVPGLDAAQITRLEAVLQQVHAAPPPARPPRASRRGERRP